MHTANGLTPMADQVIHLGDVALYDLDGYRLNWRPDNTAKVTRVEPDMTGWVQCSAAASCQVADACAFGKPHAPEERGEDASRCYDHKPYQTGGIMVWAVPVLQQI